MLLPMLFLQPQGTGPRLVIDLASSIAMLVLLKIHFMCSNHGVCWHSCSLFSKLGEKESQVSWFLTCMRKEREKERTWFCFLIILLGCVRKGCELGIFFFFLSAFQYAISIPWKTCMHKVLFPTKKGEIGEKKNCGRYWLCLSLPAMQGVGLSHSKLHRKYKIENSRHEGIYTQKLSIIYVSNSQLVSFSVDCKPRFCLLLGTNAIILLRLWIAYIYTITSYENSGCHLLISFLFQTAAIF